MADSDFDDDLDKMLQDNAEQIAVGEESIDDIDRLLDDNQSDMVSNQVPAENVDDLVDSLLDGVVTGQGEMSSTEMEAVDEFAEDVMDEFAEDPLEELLDSSFDEPLAVEQDTGNDEFADDLEGSEGGVVENNDVDEFAEEFDELEGNSSDGVIDELVESAQAIESSPVAGVGEFVEGVLEQQEDFSLEVNSEEELVAGEVEDSEETMSEIDEFADDDEEDFLLADFDISADEEEPAAVAEPVPQPIADPVITAEEPVAVMPEQVSQAVDYSGAIKAQNEKIKQLEEELSGLQQNPDFTEALEKVVSDQKKANRKTLEASNKLKMFGIIGIVLGVLALIVGVVVVVLNSGVQAEVEEVQNTVMDIEDRMAIPVIDPNNKKIADLLVSVGKLESEHTLLTKKLTQFERQTIDKSIKDADFLRTEVNQLLLGVTEKVSHLEEKIARVKVRKKRAVTTRKIAQKAKVQEWVVNLVSFKQRWYTDKKVEEFKQKGIPTEVVAVDINGVEWYRIRVAGFKNKIEAGSYAVKIKKSLNLSSIWVSAR